MRRDVLKFISFTLMLTPVWVVLWLQIYKVSEWNFWIALGQFLLFILIIFLSFLGFYLYFKVICK